MSIVYSAVDCCEVHGSISENWSSDSLTASVQLQVPWANRWSLAADLLANKRVYPHATAARASSIAISPLPSQATTDNQGLVYTDAIVTVNYSTSEEQDLIAESLEPTAEFMTLDHRRFRWTDEDGDPLTEAEAPGKLLRSLNLVRTHYRVQPPLPAILLTAIGHVNNAVYTSSLLGLPFAQETLLFTPPTLQRTITTGFDRAFNITMRFSYKPEGWNKFWRTKTQSYERIYSLDASANYDNYPQADFSSLLA